MIAAAAIFAHNHPSGSLDPSAADICLTEHLKLALATVDIVVLDHFVIAGGKWLSLAEHGLIEKKD
jgi:DNA repair protein RadC